jgi:hypothetical protein
MIGGLLIVWEVQTDFDNRFNQDLLAEIKDVL